MSDQLIYWTGVVAIFSTLCALVPVSIWGCAMATKFYLNRLRNNLNQLYNYRVVRTELLRQDHLKQLKPTLDD